jgi:hypothetical protein
MQLWWPDDADEMIAVKDIIADANAIEARHAH